MSLAEDVEATPTLAERCGEGRTGAGERAHSHESMEQRRMKMSERIRGRKGQEIRARRLLRQPLCVDCEAEGQTALATEVDHIVPLSKRGRDVDENCRALCKRHHQLRTAEQFGHRRPQTIEADGWPV